MATNYITYNNYFDLILFHFHGISLRESDEMAPKPKWPPTHVPKWPPKRGHYVGTNPQTKMAPNMKGPLCRHKPSDQNGPQHMKRLQNGFTKRQIGPRNVGL